MVIDKEVKKAHVRQVVIGNLGTLYVTNNNSSQTDGIKASPSFFDGGKKIKNMVLIHG
jgi:hypothetical protein